MTNGFKLVLFTLEGGVASLLVLVPITVGEISD